MLLKIWSTVLVFTVFFYWVNSICNTAFTQAVTGATILIFILTTVGCSLSFIWM